MKILNPEVRVCAKCSVKKDISAFRKYFEKRNEKFYYRTSCIECEKLYNSAYGTKYYQNNRTELNEYGKQWRDENREYQVNYDIENKETILQNRRKRHSEKKNDPSYKLRRRVSSIIGKVLKNNNSSKRNQSVMNYLPYTIGELKEHLENQFELWMNWNNHGNYHKSRYIDSDLSTWTWHIDHIIPQSKLLYSSMSDENFRKCWALSNLRPLKSLDNMRKGNR